MSLRGKLPNYEAELARKSPLAKAGLSTLTIPRGLASTGRRRARAATSFAAPEPTVSALEIRSILPAKGMDMSRPADPRHPPSALRGVPAPVDEGPPIAFFGEHRFRVSGAPAHTHYERSLATESPHIPVGSELEAILAGFANNPAAHAAFITSMRAPYPGASSGLTRETPMMKEKRDTESATIARRYAVSKGIAAEKLAKVVAAEDQLKQDAASAEASAAYKEAKHRYERDVLGRY